MPCLPRVNGHLATSYCVDAHDLAFPALLYAKATPETKHLKYPLNVN